MILVTGANGQIGQVLVQKLVDIYGKDEVLATDINKLEHQVSRFEFLDILNKNRLYEIVNDHEIKQVYHLAAILSANGEWKPKKTWNVNLNAYLTLLTMVKEKGIEQVFFPSTIAVYGKTTPRDNTPQHTPLLPETVYGMSKATGQFWSNYFHMKYGTDIRSIRYPGIIGYQSMPGGGTTDYAVEIFHAALKTGTYECPLEPDTKLPMMYMDDAIRATVELMSAPKERISIRSSYNLAAMSFSPEEIAAEIKKHIPSFTITYKPDFRQKIAESWTSSIDDQYARKDWGWNHAYGLEEMVNDMIQQLKNKYNV